MDCNFKIFCIRSCSTIDYKIAMRAARYCRMAFKYAIIFNGFVPKTGLFQSFAVEIKKLFLCGRSKHCRAVRHNISIPLMVEFSDHYHTTMSDFVFPCVMVGQLRRMSSVDSQS